MMHEPGGVIFALRQVLELWEFHQWKAGKGRFLVFDDQDFHKALSLM